MYIDTHTHLTDKRYCGEQQKIADNLYNDGIKFIINVGYDAKSSAGSVSLANRYDNIYAAVAIHPQDAHKVTAEDYKNFTQYALNHKTVAIGETGLDYHYEDNAPKDIQQRVFNEHIDLANSVKLPVIVHIRDAYADAYDILSSNKPKFGGVLHCYSGSAEMAERFLKLGFYISFAGAVTFKNARGIIDAVKAVPLSRILTETDCPYLTPEPYRGKLNYPSYVKHVAKKIAEIKGITTEELNKHIESNALSLFTKINK